MKPHEYEQALWDYAPNWDKSQEELDLEAKEAEERYEHAPMEND